MDLSAAGADVVARPYDDRGRAAFTPGTAPGALPDILVAAEARQKALKAERAAAAALRNFRYPPDRYERDLAAAPDTLARLLLRDPEGEARGERPRSVLHLSGPFFSTDPFNFRANEAAQQILEGVLSRISRIAETSPEALVWRCMPQIDWCAYNPTESRFETARHTRPEAPAARLLIAEGYGNPGCTLRCVKCGADVPQDNGRAVTSNRFSVTNGEGYECNGHVDQMEQIFNAPGVKILVRNNPYVWAG